MTPEYRYNSQFFSDMQIQVGSPTKTFSLNLAVCSDVTLRDFLVQQLESAYSEVAIVSFWPYSIDVFEHVHEATGAGPHDAVFVSGLDDVLASGQSLEELYTKLNRSPVRWKAWFACPIVFWVSEQTADTLREEAKDFWEWLESIYRLEAPE